MSKILISIGPVVIYWYSFIVLMAVLIGYEVAVNYCKKINCHVGYINDMILWLVIWAIIGARVYYVIFNYEAFDGDLIGMFQIWRGGLAIYGGIIGGILYIAYYCFKKKISFVRILDIFSLSLLLGQGIGRWGNFFNQEAYGAVTSLEFLKGLYIPDFIIKGMYIDGAYRQPTFLYESLWCILGVLILLFIRHKYGNQIGRQISFYLMWYGIGRFLIEGLRSDSLYFGDFRISQIVSVIIFVVGFVGTIIVWKRNHIKIRDVNVVGDRL